jgi:hypothetical protein
MENLDRFKFLKSCQAYICSQRVSVIATFEWWLGCLYILLVAHLAGEHSGEDVWIPLNFP